MNLKFCYALPVILLSVVTASYGQISSAVVTEKICKCINLKTSGITDNFTLRDSVDACFAQGMASNFGGLKEEYKMVGAGITVEEIREIKDRLWKKLEKDCEPFRKVVAKL
jgi:hypothetical protein